MRLSRLRLTLRRMMLAIAMLALLFTVIGMRMRRDVSRRAEYHRQQMMEFWVGHSLALNTGDPYSTRWAAKRREYHKAMWQKYQRAAARPWLSIDPDPPPP